MLRSEDPARDLGREPEPELGREPERELGRGLARALGNGEGLPMLGRSRLVGTDGLRRMPEIPPGLPTGMLEVGLLARAQETGLSDLRASRHIW